MSNKRRGDLKKKKIKKRNYSIIVFLFFFVGEEVERVSLIPKSVESWNVEEKSRYKFK